MMQTADSRRNDTDGADGRAWRKAFESPGVIAQLNGSETGQTVSLTLPHHAKVSRA